MKQPFYGARNCYGCGKPRRPGKNTQFQAIDIREDVDAPRNEQWFHWKCGIRYVNEHPKLLRVAMDTLDRGKKC